MYYINFNELDEDFKREFIKLLQNYYMGFIPDDESLFKYIEENDINIKKHSLNKVKIYKHD